MRKRIISILLIALIVSGALPFISSSADTGTAEKGEYTYTLSSDPDTGTVPAGFGTISNNGRIWTDKSVSVNDDHFDVNLKVLAQEYISSYGLAESHSIAADVVMVLDFTSSMLRYKVPKEDGSSVTRMEALVDSVNEAIDIITNTNPNNRIQVSYFYGSRTAAQSNVIMPLGHYTSTSSSEDTTDKYITCRLGSNYTATISSSSTLQKDGSDFTFSQSTGTGTCTQYGIVRGVNGLVEAINSETDNSIERKPYVIVMTDGEPTWGSKNWTSTNPTDLTGQTVSYSYSSYSPTGTNHNNQIISALTILSAALMRDRIEGAYTDYNGKDLGVEWFNIGLGVDEVADYTGCLVNPAYLKDVTPTNANQSGIEEAQKVKYYLNGEDWGAQSYTAKDYSADNNYVYPNEGDGYVTFANTYEVLNNAFTTLANIIRLGSMEYTVPIVNHEGSGEQSSDVEFTDVIGEGMFVTDITLKQNGKPPVTGVDEDGDGTYTFTGYDTTVTLTEDDSGQQTLVWRLPAKEVAMFTFANREDVTNGEYIAAEPTVLTYGVDFTNDIEEGPAYTNAFDQNMVPLTTVTYEIPGDNDYYFDVVKDELHNFVSSTIKPGLDGYTAKTENTTSTAPDSHSYAYTAVNEGTANSSATVNGLLGNNGKATFLSRKENIEITVEKKWEDKEGTPITDTSGLPVITVNLCRMADDSHHEEVVQEVRLSNSNNYSQTYTLPIRDQNDKRYTYYIKENCPDGYYVADISSPLRANDGTLTLINRELPDEGVLSVKKLWANKIGAEIADTSSMPAVNINLKRHVEVLTPLKHTVTIYVSDPNESFTEYKRQFIVPDGTVITFTPRIYIRSSYSTATISLSQNGGDPVTVTSDYSQVRNANAYTDDPFVYGASVNHNNRWCRETVEQRFTVTDDLTLNYISSVAINTRDFPYTRNGNVIYPYMILDLSKTEPAAVKYSVSQGEDELYESFSLSYYNEWQKTIGDLILSKPDSVNPEIIYNYKYFIEETTDVPEFTASYSENNTEGVTGGVLTVTNKSNSAIGPLPETGGKGETNIPLIGVSFVAIALPALIFSELVPRYRKKRKRAL